MNRTARSTRTAPAFHHHLHVNEKDCVRNNIVVHVESINSAHLTALCSVRQHFFGLFRQNRSSSELAWRAEQALAPLRSLGIIPLIQVNGRASSAPVRYMRSPSLWFSGAWRHLGYPFARHGYKQRIVINDPFGWRKAMHAAEPC